MKSAREKLDMIAAYNDIGSYRGATAVSGVDHKAIKRPVLGAPEGGPESTARPHNYDAVTDVVAARAARTTDRI